ncbi:MAG TPA: tripartite tricarboxylate transporter substrate binding protein [Burkholderiales bacterium]|jgi:putative tricarboxylic transport membrane protein
MKLQSRSIIAALVLAAAALPLHAQGFKPTKPVEFVAHTGPGGGADVLARFIASAMEKEKLVPVRMYVTNKVGGGGQTAMAYLTEKRGDAHTIAPFLSLFFVVPIMSAEARTTMKDLTPVARLLFEPAMVVVKNDSPYKTLKDFIDAAKQNPGQRKQAAASLGGRDWMVRQLLMKNTGANWAFISFPQMGERIAALLGGHVDMMFLEPQEVGEHIRAGNVRVIAQISDKRLPPFPNIPTVKESGYDIPNVPQVRGIMAPPGISPEALAYWENVFAKFVETPSWKKYLEQNTLVPAYLRGAELNKFVDEYSETMRGILRDGGVKVVR